MKSIASIGKLRARLDDAYRKVAGKDSDFAAKHSLPEFVQTFCAVSQKEFRLPDAIGTKLCLIPYADMATRAELWNAVLRKNASRDTVELVSTRKILKGESVGDISAH